MHALVLALNEHRESAEDVAESLKTSGHDVISSKNFSHAIHMLRIKQVDLIISDVHLENGGSVFDFLRWVRDNPSTRSTPFVLLSCRPTLRAKLLEDGLRITARSLGATAYITMQDFDSDLFRREIDSLLSDSNPTTLENFDA